MALPNFNIYFCHNNKKPVYPSLAFLLQHLVHHNLFLANVNTVAMIWNNLSPYHGPTCCRAGDILRPLIIYNK